MKKINGKVILITVWLLLFGLLVYSRFINLGWGLPYPMHPDERNMADALQQLQCEIRNSKFEIQNCFNPHFFAYGQFPLYLGYLMVYFLKFFDGDMGFPIGFQEATISLRIISVTASILNILIIIKIINLILKISNIKSQISNKTQILNDKIKNYQAPLIILIATFAPFFIQFSHFGTTESLLMLFYSLIVYFSMRLLERRTTYAVVWLSLVSGLAIATKVSSIIFLVVPIVTIMSKLKSQKFFTFNFSLIFLPFAFLLLTLFFTIFFSPHNLINFQDFVSSIRYESDVAFGRIPVFYTRQFFNTIPIWFQLTKIFPYVLGWSVFLLGGLGILGLGWKDRKINLLRFAFLIYFIPNAFLYAKWTRFMAPILPLILIFAILFMQKIILRLDRKFWIPAFAGMTILLIYPGINYLSIYQNPDIRFQATDWINKNIPENSFVISETANVVDIPLTYKKNISVVSFNFYDLDESLQLQQELRKHLEKTDYIFVPSRRIFANHSKQKYPLLNKYYEDLFSGKLGFKKVAEFSAGLNDEEAEETWTVFDHPVIRIYKKIKSF